MLSVNETWQVILTRIRGLNATAKTLIAALMMVLVMGLILVSVYAGRAEMSALPVAGPLSAEARTRLVTYMDSRGIHWEERGETILVPTEQKYSLLASMTESQVLRGDQIDFRSLVSEDNPFTDTRTKRRRYLIAKMNVLARTISQMDGIASATVVIDEPPGRPGIGQARIEPKASITVLPEGEPLNQRRVDAIASLVAGAHAGLKVGNISVIDARTGTLCQPRTADELGGSRYFDLKREAERHARQTILQVLEYIPNIRVAVNAHVDNREIRQRDVSYDEPKVGPVETSSRNLSSTNQSGGGETGVRPNTGTTLRQAGGRTSQMSDERSTERTVPFVPSTSQDIINRTGYAVTVNASVGVPKSYFVSLYREQAGEEEDAQVDQGVFDQIVTDELTKIRETVEPLIDTGAIEGAVAGLVKVHMFPDLAMATVGVGGTGGGAAAGGGSSSSLVSGGLIKGVGLSGLALLSLVMMLMMVKRAAIRGDMPTAEEIVGIPPPLETDETDLVGEAGEAENAMEGVEIDDNDIRRQQILGQINEMARNEPDEMAGLLRRWMKTDD